MPDQPDSIGGFTASSPLTESTIEKLNAVFGPPARDRITFKGVYGDGVDGMVVELPGVIDQVTGKPTRGRLRAVEGKPDEYTLEQIDAEVLCADCGKREPMKNAAVCRACFSKRTELVD